MLDAYNLLPLIFAAKIVFEAKRDVQDNPTGGERLHSETALTRYEGTVVVNVCYA